MDRPSTVALPVLLAWLALASAAQAQQPAEPEPAATAHRIYLAGGLRLSHAHFRLPDGADGPVAYLDIQNRAASPDRLVGASVDGAKTTDVVSADGSVGTLAIPPRGEIALRISGAHLVAHGWTDPGGQDGRVGATLRFARAGDVRVSLGRETEAGSGSEPEAAPAAASEAPIDLAR